MSAHTHTHERACAVIADDPATVQRINEIRKVCDPAYPRWMPHINLLYPFLQHANTTPALLRNGRAALRSIEPFTVRFDCVSKFDQAGGPRASVHLHPDEQSRQKLRQLFNALVGVFGSAAVATAKGFEPHLTIAVWPVPPAANLPPSCKGSKDFCKLCSNRFRNLAIPVTEVVIMDRHPMRGVSLSDGSGFGFKVVERLRLGGAEIKAQTVTKLQRRLITDAAQVGSAANAVAAQMLRFAVQRASVCLRRLALQRKLPKTVRGLEAVLRPFTKQRVLLDETKVFQRLKQAGVCLIGTELRKAPAGTAAPPEPAPSARTMGRGGRGGARGRGGRAPPAPKAPPRPKVAVEIVTLVEGIRHVNTPRVSGELEPFGENTIKHFEVRRNAFLLRLLNGLGKGNGKQPTPSRGHPVKITLSAFKKQLRDVCMVPCLVPAADIISELHQAGAVAVASTGEDAGLSVTYDASRLPAP